ncbi:Putative X-pro dipeptidyl-peptidase c-terminal non-catalytic domain-containing protein [Aspergillus calidoustus]|uniref:Putative X-pro dipeptidyl-peptidase c-terminal non-catalytic domain-containing protein n=1 Tax=Aspergillus calidoustus TaxID=454130 RepID=A0A0U5C0W0_ASPCI|nr:Putative X-pro dipeptidyl-peptidase c-terminal non-catalytic domain-containing protein [Aspergillus calidoustus]
MPVTFNVEVPVEDLKAPEIGHGGYQGLNPRTEVLRKGHQTAPGRRALPCDIQIDHDVAIKVRDGCTLYADIYTPPNAPARSVPAILCWSPFGKKFNGIDSLRLMTPWNLGIPDGTLSGLEKFEAPDPAEFVPHGYAIINVDSRGAFDSEGCMAIMGTQEAQDGYDVIEWLAQQEWCNGSVGMAGNSHLAIVQWFIAALQPPSLKAIAPWEGCGDLYREQFARGGIYGGDLFDHLIVKYMLRGRNGMESFRKMFEKHPLANDWWNDKRPDMKKINIPTYITATYTNTMHGMGSLRGWLEVQSAQKWLRWHPYQEWFDLWGNPQANVELLSFFDRYLKGIQNDWEQTPRVRMAVLRYGEADPWDGIVEEGFPLARTKYRNAYLEKEGNLLLDHPSPSPGAVSYNAEDPTDFAKFTYTFPTRTQLVGIPKAVLYMHCDDHDDMDVFLVLSKLSASGELMFNLNIPWKGLPVSTIDEIPADKRTEVILYQGPTGILRASQRSIDTSKSMHPNWPFYPNDKQEKIAPGTVVRLEIGIWAMGVQYEAGESLQLRVSGHYQGFSNFGTHEHVQNKGRHWVHVGGEYNSHLVLPFA